MRARNAARKQARRCTRKSRSSRKYKKKAAYGRNMRQIFPDRLRLRIFCASLAAAPVLAGVRSLNRHGRRHYYIYQIIVVCFPEHIRKCACDLGHAQLHATGWKINNKMFELIVSVCCLGKILCGLVRISTC